MISIIILTVRYPLFVDTFPGRDPLIMMNLTHPIIITVVVDKQVASEFHIAIQLFCNSNTHLVKMMMMMMMIMNMMKIMMMMKMMKLMEMMNMMVKNVKIMIS